MNILNQMRKPKAHKDVYLTPTLRVINLCHDESFLASNTEPIIDDGEEHGWD